MQTIQISERTSPDGTLSLRLPLGRPDTDFEVVVIVHPKGVSNGPPTPPTTAGRWAAIDAFRERLAATGRDFGDSVQEIREDRDR